MMAEAQASALAGQSPTSSAPIDACAASHWTGTHVAVLQEGCLFLRAETPSLCPNPVWLPAMKK